MGVFLFCFRQTGFIVDYRDSLKVHFRIKRNRTAFYPKVTEFSKANILLLSCLDFSVMKAELNLNQNNITMRNLQMRCWLAIIAVFIFCCTGSVQAQFQNTVVHNKDKDHYSIVTSVLDPTHSVVAETINRGTLDVHLMEIDALGSVVFERIYQTSFKERVFHITESLNGGYILCGAQDPGDGLDHGWILEVDPSFGFVNEVLFNNVISPRHTPALHISASINDPQPGYVITGFVATGYGNPAPKEAYVRKLDPTLGLVWERFFNANSGQNQDWDMASHSVEVPQSGYFVGGSSTGNPAGGFCDQVVLALLLDYNGNVQWLNAVEDNPISSIGHASVGADAFYNAATHEIYQLANYSIIHHFGVNVWDVNTGALNGATSFEVFSSLGYANIAGFKILESHNPDNFLVAGYIRSASISDPVTGALIADGSFPIAAEFNKYSTAVVWDYLYPVPSSNYFVSSSYFDAFSQGQQSRIYHPKMALRQQAGSGYELVGPRLRAGLFETELLELDANGRNGCINTEIALIPQMLNPTFHFIGNAPGAILSTDPNLIPVGVSSSEEPCSQPSTCTPDATFNILNNGNCCYTFIGLPVSADNAFCSEWTINGVVVGSGVSAYTHCFTAPGVYTICHISCCINIDGTIITATNCQTIQVDCPGGPCIPDANFSMSDQGNCCYLFQDLTPTATNVTCQQWQIFDPFGNLIGSNAGSLYSFCFDVDGIYQICYTDCCINSDGSVSTVTSCQVLVVDCCCLPFALVADVNGCNACLTYSTQCLNEAIMVTYDYGDGTFGTDPCHTYSANGNYSACMTACCINDDGTIGQCITLCTPVIITDCAGCDFQGLITTVEEVNCVWTWTFQNLGATPLNEICVNVNGVITTADLWSQTVDFTGYCGGYGLCYEFWCCEDPTNTLAICIDYYVNCCGPCDPNPEFSVIQSDCCVSLNLFGSDPCLLTAAGATVDVNGDGVINAQDTQILINSGCCIIQWGDGTSSSASGSLTHCYNSSGVYTICYTACCIGADGQLYSETFCLTVNVQCCCLPDSLITDVDACHVCVYPVFNCNQGSTLVSYTYGDGTVGTAPCHDYATSGTYTVCVTTCCINPDGTVGQCNTLCTVVTVNCCQVPSFVNFDVFTFENCEMGFCINPTVDPNVFCATWSFGDGTVENYPTDICPTHVYNCSGVYNVCVTIYCCNDPSQAVSTCRDIQVDCCKLPSSVFVDASVNGCTVTATWGSTDDYCPPLCFEWILEDGTVIPGVDILTYTFDDCAPLHTICLRVFCCNNPNVVIEKCVTLEMNCCTLPFEWFYTTDQCTACFAPIFEGPCPTDCITWDFGDGTTGTGLNPCHTYPANGVYIVCMTACCCSNLDATGNPIDPTQCTTICKEVVISDCGCSPVGPFDFNWITSTDNCGQFGFCPLLTFAPAGYCATWNFGDGTIVDTALEFCPVHTYECAGVYTVCLTIYCCTDPSISSTVCNEITVDCGCKLPSSAAIVYTNNGCNYDFSLVSTDDYCGEICVNWDLGDGSSASGWMVSHNYTANGTYTVCATVFCCNNPSEIYTVCITIVVNCECCYPQDFSYSAQNCGVCVTPIFPTDCMNPSTVMFDYGDGTGLTSDLCHTYSGSGTYLVCMYAECPGIPPVGIICHEVTVNCCCTPNADFTWELGQNDCCVIFHDLTPDGNIYGCESWVFGLIQSQLAGDDVTFCFPGPGVYTICHYDCCVDAAGNVIYDEYCIDITIDCGQPCIDPSQIDPTQACIDVYDPVCGCDGITYPNACYAYYYGGVTSWTPGPCNNGCCLPQDLIYSLNDNCCLNFAPLFLVDCVPTGNSYMWDFGDGNLSSLENSTHCFASNGIYHVCLTVTCPSGASIVFCQDITINCNPCPVDCDVHAAFNQSVILKTAYFSDNSHSGAGTTIVSWFWDFGDGNTSVLQNPTHTYTTTGSKTVCLTVTGVNADGTTCVDTYCYVVKLPCIGDLNFDGIVNITDLLVMLGVFNSSCP